MAYRRNLYGEIIGHSPTGQCLARFSVADTGESVATVAHQRRLRRLRLAAADRVREMRNEALAEAYAFRRVW